jgi:hypothetical protein
MRDIMDIGIAKTPGSREKYHIHSTLLMSKIVLY